MWVGGKHDEMMMIVVMMDGAPKQKRSKSHSRIGNAASSDASASRQFEPAHYGVSDGDNDGVDVS